MATIATAFDKLTEKLGHEPTREELIAELARVEDKKARKEGQIELGTDSGLYARISEKGAISVYGLGRFPVTLYFRQWVKIIEVGSHLLDFIEANKSKLADKKASE